jgi:hypothetical protein
MKKYTIFLIFLIFSGCLPTLKFEAIPCNKFKDCKETIKKVYVLQKPNRAPKGIVVTDEYIAWSKDVAVFHTVTGATSTHDFKNVIYFKDIENLRLIYDRSSKIIAFINKANGTKHDIYLSDEDYAIQGYSAIKCMIEKNKSKSDELL